MITILVPKKVDQYLYELKEEIFTSVQKADEACVLRAIDLENDMTEIENLMEDSEMYFSPRDKAELTQKLDLLQSQYLKVTGQELRINA